MVHEPVASGFEDLCLLAFYRHGAGSSLRRSHTVPPDTPPITPSVSTMFIPAPPAALLTADFCKSVTDEATPDFYS